MPRKIRGIDYRCLVGTYGTKHCAPFCGAGRRYLQRGMELYRYGECWAVKNIFERRPKLTARTSFPCGQLDENGCLQGKGAQKESSTGCMLKVPFRGLRYVPVFRRKLRQTKKIISLTYDNQQINRRAARCVVFIRESSRNLPSAFRSNGFQPFPLQSGAGYVSARNLISVSPPIRPRPSRRRALFQTPSPVRLPRAYSAKVQFCVFSKVYFCYVC